MKAVNRDVAGARQWNPAGELPRVIAALRSAQRILLTMHQGPDGDGLGTTLGMAAALREAGRTVVVYNPDEVPFNLRFLPGASEIVRTLPADARFDVTLVADTGGLARVGRHLPPQPARGVLINLDHHITSEPFGDLNYVDPEAAAVGVLAYKILRGLGLPISTACAEGLYASILTDTGSFHYSSTDPECLRIAAALLEAGVDPWKMSMHIYEQQPLARVRLLGAVLSTLQLTAGGKLATVTVTQEMLRACGAAAPFSDGFINHARSVAGVEVAASLHEPEQPGAWRVSFRSRGTVDVSRIAQQFGGGGHKNAAGCSIEGDEATVRERVAAALEQALRDS